MRLLAGFLSISAAAFIYLFKQPYAIGSVPTYRVTQLRTYGVHCRESAGTGPVVLKVVLLAYDVTWLSMAKEADAGRY